MSQNITTDQTQTLLAIDTSIVQGEDVGAKCWIILVSVGQDRQETTSWVCNDSCCHVVGDSVHLVFVCSIILRISELNKD